MASAPVSSALWTLSGIEASIEQVEEQVSAFMEKITFLILFKILQRAGNHARIAHRAKINVFDVLRALLSVNYSPKELKLFLAWCKFQGQRKQISAPAFAQFNQERELKLEFSPIPALPVEVHRKVSVSATPASLSNISGCQYYPPIPPAFTYKFTPVKWLHYLIFVLTLFRFTVNERMMWLP